MTNMTLKIFGIFSLILAVGLVVAGLLYTGISLGGAAALRDANRLPVTDGSSCDTETSTAVVVTGSSARVLATSTDRAWAKVQMLSAVQGAPTTTINVNFNQDVPSAFGRGTALNSTTTTAINEQVFGLNTDFPYTGSVTAIGTNGGNTAVLVTECNYNHTAQ